MVEDSIEKNFEEVNKFRKSLGIRKLVRKERNCLRCEKKFVSTGPGHRMCGCTKEEI